ncbi:MAG: sigma-54-dependent Fis family transcriptional regulator [Alphaproteobacteria bacterium]|nr:sigma-54-dependent Fis family transcriptional regulator [Alphaproteobacteria bacterium]MCB9791530.1 sigma-54-dependent Fis family transcriptional regulator [Alphaproteobacteria bacterium]
MSELLLIVDDEPGIRYALRVVLADQGYRVLEAGEGRQALGLLEQHPEVALVISDLRMPGMDGLSLLDALQRRPHAPPLILITAHGSERRAVEAMKRGALDYFSKPFDEEELLRVVQRAMTTARLSQRVRRLEAGLVLQRSMVFASEAMGRVAELVERVAPRDIPVLITGEAGTGKELVARAIVSASPRANQPYRPFNCAALTPELAASELFGHVRGAFTGAERSRAGLLRDAEGGTVLLDEVGELHPRVQGSLLRALQERAVRPVGATQALPLDVRVLSATNRPLQGSPEFREDLYYRLNVVEIRLPPLRERPEDVLPLARHFAAQAAERFGLDEVRLSAELERRLAQRAWPGNVRELKNMVERLVALSSGPLVDASAWALAERGAEPAPPSGLKAQVDAFERELLQRTLAECEGNQSEAARRLEVSRMTLVSKLKKHGVR